MNKTTVLIELALVFICIFDISMGYIATDGLRNTFSYSTWGYISFYWGLMLVVIIFFKYIYLLTRILLKDWITKIIKETK